MQPWMFEEEKDQKESNAQLPGGFEYLPVLNVIILDLESLQ